MVRLGFPSGQRVCISPLRTRTSRRTFGTTSCTLSRRTVRLRARVRDCVVARDPEFVGALPRPEAGGRLLLLGPRPEDGDLGCPLCVLVRYRRLRRRDPTSPTAAHSITAGRS